MATGVEDCEADLKRLRRNRGLCLARSDQVGDALRTACGVSTDDTPVSAVRKVTEVLSRRAGALGSQQRLAVLTALGLEGPESRFLQERQEWLARELERDSRTARRRVDEGFAELASLLSGTETAAAVPTGSWHTEHVRVLLALDQPKPETFVLHRVVADADPLDELDLADTLTAADQVQNDISVDVFAGGTLLCGRSGIMVRPPVPLRRGQKHEIALRFRVAEVLPHCVCVPKDVCTEMALTVRFGTRIPRAVELLEKIVQNEVRSRQMTGVSLEPDSAGEVHAHFRDLDPGFAYGVRWEE
ncbi:hypothetical protein FHR84_000531 [Actinopolyspora biskrensis]|uniref:Uncharacterized protein n=1 Tax=Actinopolyspora biskrensis TaxID=1470178 RepID=A0A852Z4E7_9ACTN|nr:hypothetical protein [Actinopolyspora biskrensis]NYH77217.1 hypothetical protein [Actinopolyspora biskrensis]